MEAREEWNQVKDSDDMCVWASNWGKKLLDERDKALKLAEAVLSHSYTNLIVRVGSEGKSLHDLALEVVQK